MASTTATAETAGFVAVFSTSSHFTLGASLPFRREDGLVACYTLSGELHTIWSSEERFRSASPAFVNWLEREDGLRPKLLRSSPQLQRRETAASKPWWEGKVYLWVVQVVALLGVMNTILLRYDDWFARARVAPVMSPKAYDALQGQEVEATFRIRNVTPRAVCHLHIRKMTLFPADSDTPLKQLPLLEKEVPAVSSGDVAFVPIAWTPEEPGQYVVRVEGVARAGRWALGRKFAFEQELRAWPERYAKEEPSLSQRKGEVTPKRAKVIIEIDVGPPVSGLEGLTRVLRTPRVKIDSVHSSIGMDRCTPAGDVSTPGAESVSVQWATPPVKGRQRVRLIVWLRSEAGNMTREKWEGLIGDPGRFATDIQLRRNAQKPGE